jgi:hypothetical protein
MEIKDSGYLSRNTDEGKKIRKRDPLTFIFWGLLLILYGLYAFYNFINNIEAMNKNLLILAQSIIMIMFGSMVFFIGFRDRNI